MSGESHTASVCLCSHQQLQPITEPLLLEPAHNPAKKRKEWFVSVCAVQSQPAVRKLKALLTCASAPEERFQSEMSRQLCNQPPQWFVSHSDWRPTRLECEMGFVWVTWCFPPVIEFKITVFFFFFFLISPESKELLFIKVENIRVKINLVKKMSEAANCRFSAARCETKVQECILFLVGGGTEWRGGGGGGRQRHSVAGKM